MEERERERERERGGGGAVEWDVTEQRNPDGPNHFLTKENYVSVARYNYVII